MQKYRILLIYIAVLAVVIGVGVWLFQSSNKQAASLPGQTVEDQGQAHITEGSTEHPPYNSNPPTSGPHWPQAAAWGVYTTTQPDERLIHNLEHGGIWISFKPDKVDQDTIYKLNDFASRYRKIIVEPREKNEAAIALSAWTHLQNLDQYNETEILKFIEAFYDQGPEKVD